MSTDLRSVLAKLAKRIEPDLILDSSELVSGHWVIEPPELVNNTGQWSNEADAPLRDAQGQLRYKLFDDQGTEYYVDINWCIPYFGENGFSISCAWDEVNVGYTGGDGGNATVNYYIEYANRPAS